MPLGMPTPDLRLLDPTLPARLAELRDRHTSWTPEMKLMAAVLEDAVCTFYRCARSRTGAKRLLFLETAEWFESIDTSSPFTFLCVCRVLGIDPDDIRAGLPLGALRSIAAPAYERNCETLAPYCGVATAGIGVRIGALIGCVTLGAFAVLAAAWSQTWALARITYF
jgi:hypothetical protein